jgi:hypothetical protein
MAYSPSSELSNFISDVPAIAREVLFRPQTGHPRQLDWRAGPAPSTEIEVLSTPIAAPNTRLFAAGTRDLSQRADNRNA